MISWYHLCLIVWGWGLGGRVFRGLFHVLLELFCTLLFVFGISDWHNLYNFACYHSYGYTLFCIQNALELVTWNVKGIGNIIKRNTILTFLIKKNYYHAIIGNSFWIKEIGLVRFIFPHSLQISRGTAILIHKNIPFILKHSDYVSEGRFVLIFGLIHGRHFTVGNVYALNTDCPNFMSHVVLKFYQHCKNIVFFWEVTLIAYLMEI